jgi:hypothetical protein
MTTPLRTALSLAVHESPPTIVDQCLNLAQVGGFDAIVLHVNANAALDTEALMRLIDTVPPLRGVVRLNPTRLATDWVAPGLLHRAHIANFRWLRTQCAFDVFATDASNTLLVRPGLKDHLGAHELGIDSVPACGWQSAWEANLRNDLLFEMAGGEAGCKRNQIEGLFMRAALFEQVAAWIDGYEARYEAQVTQGREPQRVPREEYLFATALHQLGHAAQGTAYMMMRQGSALGLHHFENGENKGWRNAMTVGTGFSWELFEIERSLAAGRLWPLYWDVLADHVPPIPDFAAYKAGKFGIKRVQRDIHDPVRRRVGEHFGYREWTLAAEAAGR